MAPERQRRKCAAFPWDEVLTMKGGAAESNAVGISRQMKQWEVCETNEAMALSQR